MQKPVRVGVRRPGGDLLGRAVLDDFAGVHDRQAVADLEQEREVMGNEDDAEADLVSEALDLVKDLLLDHDVKRGGRLVHDDDLGLQGQGHRDDHSLAHPARELVRERPDAVRGNADHVEELPAPLLASGRVHLRDVLGEDIRELLAHADDGVERVHGALEDHRDPRPAEPAERRGIERHDVDRVATGAAVELDLAAGQAGRRAEQPGERVGQRGLPAAALAGDAEDLPAAELKADVAYRMGGSGAGVLDRDVFGQEHDIAGASAGLSNRARGWGHWFLTRSRHRLFGALYTRRRGFRISSRPKLISARPVPTSAMHRPGGTNHHQAPLESASSFCAK